MGLKEVPTIKRAMLFAASILYCCLVTASPVEAAVVTVRADGTGDYPTIQAAMNAANNADVVVLEPGAYTGEGNRNLDFKGKAITVRSVNPYDNSCMRETIIDAEGKGVIVRFVNDEGPEAIFEGFSLGAGDTSTGVRGVPGFFEFSKNARPTTRRLRIEITEGGVILPQDYDPNWPGDIPPDGRAWYGYNPFHQPAVTTDYYGSGDVDNDGNLTSSDVSLAQDIADGLVPPVARADADGDGDVDGSDVSLIGGALGGGVLPGWWNSLTTAAQRNNWIDKILAIDKTDEHTYYSSYFVCHHFAYQTGIHGALLRADFATESTEYNGGQTVFNVPLYFVTVSVAWHAINGILVGDDPLNFDDWRFIEPQNDWDVQPGNWNMPYGCDVRIEPQNLYWNPEVMVVFHVDANGWSLVDNSPDLVTTRPAPTTEPADNRPDLWNARIIPSPNGAILFERMRDDMSRTTDIHIADLPFTDGPAGTALVMDPQFSRLLDTFQEPNGTVHLLWEGKSAEYKQNLFHGILDPVNHVLSNVSQVAADLRLPSMGRVIVTPDDVTHIFWFEHQGYSGMYEYGIHWTKWTGSGWETAQNLTPGAENVGGNPDWLNRQFARYVFDTEVLDNGDIMLIWVEKVFPTFYINQLRYDGTWNSSRIEDTGWYNSLRGVDLCKDCNGIVHLAYWRGDRQQPGGTEEGRGDLYHRTFDGVSWSSPAMVDSSGGVCCPRMAADRKGRVYMAWERKTGDQVVPMWSEYESGTWQTAQELIDRPDANAWYPRVDVLADKTVVFTWSSRSDDRVAIGMDTIEPIAGDFDWDRDVDLADLGFFVSHWLDVGCDDSAGDETDWCFGTDINRDSSVNFGDYAKAAANWLVGVEPPPEEFYEDFETGDFSKYDWQHSGGASWAVVSDVVYEGSYAAKSGAIIDNQQSILEITFNVEFDYISFYRKVSSENWYDFLRFYIDGVKQGEWAGEEDWALETYPITHGLHTLNWSYEKDFSVSSGSDCVWIDQITLP